MQQIISLTSQILENRESDNLSENFKVIIHKLLFIFNNSIKLQDEDDEEEEENNDLD